MPQWKAILLSLWKVRVLRRFLDKLQQMSMGSWVKAFCSISVESAGSQKIPSWNANKFLCKIGWKISVQSLWKLRALARKNVFAESGASMYHCGKCGFSEDSLIKNATNYFGKLGESFLFNLCGNCGLSKNASVESDTSMSHCGKCGFSEDSSIKCNKCLQKVGWKLSVQSVESAGCQKMPQGKAILLSLWKVRVLRRFLDKMQKSL